MRILITGGAGFIGGHFVRYMVNRYPQHDFINFDKLTYAGDLDRVKDLEGKLNYKFVKGDVCDLNFMCYLLKNVEAVFHFAAESHVDNSIGNSLEFTKSNTYGTHVLLEAARINGVKRIIHISTDEIYGDVLEGSFKESDNFAPNNPYSASKAAAEMIAMGYLKTYKMPITIVRGNNVYGSFQYPEKIIPRFVTDLMEGKKVPLHGDGSNIRAYIHVEDVCRAIEIVFGSGGIGEVYNIGTSDEIANIELTREILRKMGKDESFINFIPDRPFNDRRYSLDLSKIRGLGWKQLISFPRGLDETIEWYKSNEAWWNKFKKRLP